MVDTSNWSCRANRTQSTFRAVGVGTEPRGINPFNGALRERLRVEAEDGSVELLVVRDLGEVCERIEGAVAGARG